MSKRAKTYLTNTTAIMIAVILGYNVPGSNQQQTITEALCAPYITKDLDNG